jgi:ketosteroid isomerase-like protein
MTQETGAPKDNLEIIRGFADAYNEAGIHSPRLDDFMAEDIEFHEPPEQPAPRVAKGREEFRALFGEFDSAWAEHRSEIEEIQAISADQVLCVSVERFKGRDGIELSAPSAGVFTLRDGKISVFRAFWDKKSALKAAGLAE